MDEHEPRPAVRSCTWAEVEADWPGAPEDGGHEEIDSELVRWGWDIADDRYMEGKRH